MGYSKQIYQKARLELDARRLGAQDAAAERRRVLYEKQPRFAQIEKSLAQTGIDAAKAALSADKESMALLQKLRDENLLLQAERAALLDRLGLPKDYLKVRYTCAQCGDTGYIAQNRCRCMEDLLRRLACSAISETPGLQNCRFDTFSLNYYPTMPDQRGVVPRQRMEKVLQICLQYARDFSPGVSESILLFGGTGLGKTHLSLSIAYEVVQRGFGVYYTSCQALMDKLQAQQFGRLPADDTTDYLTLASQCDLLILDDFGAEFSTTFTVSVLQNLINSRLTQVLPTVINSNLSDKQLDERYGERLVSRLLCAYRAIPVYGEDIRKIKRFKEVKQTR